MPWRDDRIPQTREQLAHRNASIVRRAAKGIPTKLIARAWNVSERTVQRLVAEWKRANQDNALR